MYTKIAIVLVLTVLLSACAFQVVSTSPGVYNVYVLKPTDKFATPTPDDWLTLTAFPIPSPVPTSAAPTPTPITPLYVCPTGDYVNIRQLNSATSTWLGTLYAGQRLLMTGQLKDNWYQVQYKNAIAYVSATYTKLCTTGTWVQ